MKAFLILNKNVRTNECLLLEGVFWKKKHAREFAKQLIRKTGTLNYKFLYQIVPFKFEQQPLTDYNAVTTDNHPVVVLHTLIKKLCIE